jgi:hypothetical protein
VNQVDLPTETPDSLDWRAFCYVTGEMSPDEADDWELRLAEDEQASAAVARAVALIGALLAGAPETVARPARGEAPVDSLIQGRWRWTASAIAALALVGMGVALLYRPQFGADGTIGGRHRALPMKWMALWSEGDDARNELDFNAVPSRLIADIDDADRLDVPTWMLAALKSDEDDVWEEN